MKKQPLYVKKLVLSAMFMALGLILPFITGQLQQVGTMLLPMHIPVLLCGLICGWQYGAVVGFVLPLLRYSLFGMPPIYPMGISMAFELAAYGAVIGICRKIFRRKKWFATASESKRYILDIYFSLVVSMICGRIVWGLVRYALASVTRQAFTWQMFVAGAFVTAIPGIVIQLILIPALMIALDRAGIWKETNV